MGDLAELFIARADPLAEVHRRGENARVHWVRGEGVIALICSSRRGTLGLMTGNRTMFDADRKPKARVTLYSLIVTEGFARW